MSLDKICFVIGNLLFIEFFKFCVFFMIFLIKNEFVGFE